MRRMCTIIRLMTSVWPSVCGWKAMDLVSLVSNIDQRVDQNVLRNLLSRSEMIECGIPKCTHTRSKKSLVVASAEELGFEMKSIHMSRRASQASTSHCCISNACVKRYQEVINLIATVHCSKLFFEWFFPFRAQVIRSKILKDEEPGNQSDISDVKHLKLQL
jgi:hypothetical protein